MSTLTANRQPPQVVIEIARLLLEAFVEVYDNETADWESPDSDTQPAEGGPAHRTGTAGEYSV